MKKFLTIIGIAIISSVVLSLLGALPYYRPASEQLPNNYNSSIWEMFFLYGLYLTIPLVIGGIIGVALMDKASKSLNFFKKVPYVANVLLYIMGGFVISCIAFFFFSGGILIESYVIFSLFLAIGIIGALLFLHFYLFARRILRIK